MTITAPGLAAAAAAGGQVPGRPGQYASPIGQDRLVRREVALGLIREIVPPTEHLGLQIFPFMEVDSDDVVFSYAMGLTEGLANARAEDAEADLAQKDDMFLGEGRASVIDWAVKDHYTASDVQRYREWLLIKEQVRDTQNLPLTAGPGTQDWQRRMARDTLRRRRKLDNRIEWMIMSQALSTGRIVYNDGKIKFTVDFGRPSVQQGLTPTSTALTGYTMGAAWGTAESDPIGDIQAIQQYMFDVYGVRITRAITSRKVLNSLLSSSKFIARTGLVVGGTPTTPIDAKYLIDGWGPNAAQAIVEQQTGLTFIPYDSVYRSRAVGSQTVVNNRFTPQNRVIFLPNEEDINAFDDTDLGFGKVLTSPHPAGNWQPGFYEWEHEFGVDPWGLDAGTGVKAFLVPPHMDLTVTYDVMA